MGGKTCKYNHCLFDSEVQLLGQETSLSDYQAGI